MIVCMVTANAERFILNPRDLMTRNIFYEIEILFQVI